MLRSGSWAGAGNRLHNDGRTPAVWTWCRKKTALRGPGSLRAAPSPSPSPAEGPSVPRLSISALRQSPSVSPEFRRVLREQRRDSRAWAAPSGQDRACRVSRRARLRWLTCVPRQRRRALRAWGSAFRHQQSDSRGRQIVLRLPRTVPRERGSATRARPGAARRGGGVLRYSRNDARRPPSMLRERRRVPRPGRRVLRFSPSLLRDRGSGVRRAGSDLRESGNRLIRDPSGLNGRPVSLSQPPRASVEGHEAGLRSLAWWSDQGLPRISPKGSPSPREDG